jgi:hypothetical protein
MKRFLFFLVSLLSAGTILIAAVAAEENVKVTTVFDKRSVSLNDEIKFTIRITGAQANILRPRIPHIESFESYYTGRSSQFTFVNGRSENATTFSYVLVPKQVGTFMIPPIEVEVDDQLFRTDPIELSVTVSQAPASAPVTAPAAPGGPASTSPPAVPVPSGPAPPFAQPRQNVQKPAAPTLTPDMDQNIFLNVAADKLEAYPNQQILLEYSVYTRLSARAEQFEKDPNLTGFWVEEIPIERDYQAEKIIYQGLQYVKADVRRLAIFPTGTGTFEIDPGVFRVTVKKEERPSSLFDEFFDESFFGGSFFARREQRLLTARPLQIRVRPLPEQGKPADFSGMVGRFRMNSAVNKRAVKQNEPVTLTLTLEGEGNIEIIERPKIPPLKDVKIFDSDSSTELSKTRQGLAGKKTFEVTLIPMEPGPVEIPPISFSYFDPVAGAYQTLVTQAYRIEVSPGPAVMLGETGAAPATEKELKKSIRLESRDIHFIKEKFGPERRAWSLENAARFFLAADAFLSLGCFLIFLRARRQERLDQDVALRRSLEASRRLLKGLRVLRKLSVSARSEDARRFFDQVPKVLSHYFADKFNVSERGITFGEIESRLQGKGASAALVDEVRALYEMCDRIRFTSSEIPEIRRDELLRVIQDVVQFMDKR